jgi:hypothetical protein
MGFVFDWSVDWSYVWFFFMCILKFLVCLGVAAVLLSVVIAAIAREGGL